VSGHLGWGIGAGIVLTGWAALRPILIGQGGHNDESAADLP
jgi:hypothetical protein